MTDKIAVVVPMRDFPTKTPGFDYQLKAADNLTVGQLCQVNFRNRNELGYIFSISDHSQFTKLKCVTPLSNQIIADTGWIETIKWFSRYYHYSLGSTIKLFSPQFGKKLVLKATPLSNEPLPTITSNKFEKVKFNKDHQAVLFHADKPATIAAYYLSLANQLKKANQSLLIICPDQTAVSKLCNTFSQWPVIILDASLTDKVWRENWLTAVSEPEFKIVIATQKGCLTPVKNLGAIVVDQENSPNHLQQERNPRYDCRLVAFNYAKNLKQPLIFTSLSPSIYSLNLVQQKQLVYYSANIKNRAKFKVVDRTTELVASKEMFGPISEHYLRETLAAKKSVFIFSFYHDSKKVFCLNCGLENSSQQKACSKCRQLLMADKKSTVGINIELAKLKLPIKFVKNDASVGVGGLRHLPNLENVGLSIFMDPDNILNIPSFSSAEKLRSIIDQLNAVSERLLVISKNINHHCYQANFMDYVKTEFAIRKKYHQFPFGEVVHVSASKFNESDVTSFKSNLKQINPDIEIFGPELDRAQRQYYLLVKATNSKDLENVAEYLSNDWILNRYPSDLKK